MAPILPTRIPRPGAVATVAKIYRLDQPVESLALPAYLSDNLLLTAETVPPDTLAILPQLVAMVHRIVPWAPLVLTPCLLEDVDARPSYQNHRAEWEFQGKRYLAFGGMACFPTTGQLIVCIGYTSQTVLQTAVHEAWHMLEAELPKHWVELVDSMIEGDHFCPPDNYSSSRMERRARAFEAWCLRLIEGLPGECATTPIDEIFAMAWNGELAATVTERWEQEAA